VQRRLALRGALRPQTGRPWSAGPKDKAAGGTPPCPAVDDLVSYKPKSSSTWASYPYRRPPRSLEVRAFLFHVGARVVF
jgi:hypothetical protein